jgi:hypothetical protein
MIWLSDTASRGAPFNPGSSAGFCQPLPLASVAFDLIPENATKRWENLKSKRRKMSPAPDWRSQLGIINELVRVEKEKAANWGWPELPETLQLMGQLPPDVVSFEELRKRPEARHKSKRELVAFLKRYQYPYIDTGRIPIAGYEKALRLRDEKQRDRKRLERQCNRANSRKGGSSVK